MFHKVCFLWLLICSIFHFGNSANILFFFTGGTYSHDISIWPLVIRLADRNHSVTFYSAHSKKPWNDPRVTVITPPKIEQINSGYFGDALAVRLQNQEASLWKSLWPWSYEICKYILTDPKKPETEALFYGKKFDVVILDAVLCDCGHIIGYYHKAKVIVSDSTSVLPWFHHIYGFSAESSWAPAIPTLFQYPMSVVDVIENYFEPIYWTYIRRNELYPKLEALMKELFKTSDIPSFLELERRASLIFVNTHHSIELPRSLPDNVVQIGGMQIWGQKSAAIPEDISQFIDKAEEGVILLAFGSNVDFANIPKEFEQAFFDAFASFPKINFIAKASGSKPENAPENLRYEKWIPQKEILANPKTLACITHGGLNGIIEATYFGVPLITIPLFAEQDYQSYKLQARELGIRLELRGLTDKDLISAISSITRDPKYRKNIRRMQKAFRDRPQNPVDLASYWVEYALRHDDMSHMNPITYQTWTIFLEQYIFSFYSLISAAVVAIIVPAATIRLLLK